MLNLPHHYTVAADAQPDGYVTTSSPGLASIEAAPPAEFGGPGDRWSPETFLVAAVTDCFVLSFRAVARASRLEWSSLHCSVEGVLDRPEKLTQFTEFHLRVVLDVPAETDQNKARRVIDKAEHTCLITNSLSAATHLDAEIRVAD
jgi:organic hydroperoxide reductase OsmC/OhrA